MIVKRYIGVRECAEYLGIKVSTVYSWVHLRNIPYIKMGRLVKFDILKLESWIKEKEIKTINL